VSLLEVVAAVGIDEFKLSRRTSTLLAGAMAAVVGVSAALSSDALGVLDKIAGEFFVVVGVLGMALLFGWRMKDPIKELAAGAPQFVARLVPGAVFLVRYIIPPVLAVMAWIAFRDMMRTFLG
jgi:SNF family Na+-dependent transporter